MSREPELVRVKVSDATQLSFDGKVFASGAVIEAPEHIALRWIVRGWAEAKEPAAKPAPRNRRTG